MLKTRIITALVLLAILLVAVFVLPDWAWGFFTLGIVLAASWEWSRFCALARPWSAVYAVVTLVLCASVLLAYWQGGLAGIAYPRLMFAAFSCAAVFWLMAAPLWLARLWRPLPGFRALAGAMVILPTWFAFLSLREVSPWLLLSFAAIVWVADIAAYFAGRRFGRHKLAPEISPGKTVEGAVGGIAGVILFFFGWKYVISLTALHNENWVRELQSHGWILLALFVSLAAMSIVGDLFESWMKRGVGLKDSSNLLPGHGGVLDRIDALTSTLPLAGLYVALMSGAPGR